MAVNQSDKLLLVDDLAAGIQALGEETGLPCIAVSADLSSPEPMVDSAGAPYAASLFRWLDPDLEYWKDRGFALKSPFVTAVRFLSEPFYYFDGRMRTWRANESLESIDVSHVTAENGVGGAIIAPTYLPGGVIGAVVWATADPRIDLPGVFSARAERLHLAALRFVSAYHDLRGKLPTPAGGRLTRREIQALKWAAAGKTDIMIGELLRISPPTVRFHLKNAAEKLGVVGRSQAVREAAALGYVGLGLNPARHAGARRPAEG